MTARKQKQIFLEQETALSQAEASLIIGCPPRDVQNHIKPTFHLNGRPKYRQADVLAARAKWIAAAQRKLDRTAELQQSV